MKKLDCILLIDDNANDNYYHFLTIRETLSTKQIKTVKDGVEALAYLEAGKTDPAHSPFPDLVFLDINMPGMDGFEFLEKIKENDLFLGNKPVVIVMTNFMNEENEIKAKEVFSDEIVAFISKPLTTAVLKNIITQYFN